MEPIKWSDFPLPLIQVNPPSLEETNKEIITAYQKGIFSNSAELQRKASSELSKLFNEDAAGYLASSNTAAITACLLTVGVRGRHVVISNFTFAATLDAVILAGGIPIICDIDPNSLVLDFEKTSEILKSEKYDVAAVLPTRILGFITDLSKLVEQCDAHKVPVIVDAAGSLPCRENSWKFEHNALYEVFSLHATKVFGIGEGGLVIGDPESIERVRQSSNFGFSSNGSMKFRDGLNAKADEFTSARTLARLQSYSIDIEKRQDFVLLYKKAFSGDSRFRLIEDNKDTVYSYFPIIFDTEEQLLSFQMATSPFFMSRRYYFPSLQSGYIGDAEVVFTSDLGISESIAKRILCLPVYVSYQDEVRKELESLLKLVVGK